MRALALCLLTRGLTPLIEGAEEGFAPIELLLSVWGDLPFTGSVNCYFCRFYIPFFIYYFVLFIT